MSDWNAQRYHDISAPQQAWGRRVLDRLTLSGDELVLDLGCGTGRLTEELQRRLAAGRGVGADRSEAMIESAAMWLCEHAPRAALVQADGAALPFRAVFDAVFSGATFHWILDHGALFRSIVTALKPGGRLVAQCGGAAEPRAAARPCRSPPRRAGLRVLFRGLDGALVLTPTWSRRSEGSTRPASWTSTSGSKTRRRRSPARMSSRTSWPRYACAITSPSYRRGEQKLFLSELTTAAAQDSPAFTLDYSRLNIAARRPA